MRTKASRMRNKTTAEINMGAFSDIAFQLIIFFMICASFNKPKAQEMEMPSGEEKSEESAKKNPTISLSSTSMRLNNQSISRARLEEWLRSQQFHKLLEADQASDTVVVLEAQPAVSYARFYDVVRLVEKHGGTITILEEEKEGSDGG